MSGPCLVGAVFPLGVLLLGTVFVWGLFFVWAGLAGPFVFVFLFLDDGDDDDDDF